MKRQILLVSLDKEMSKRIRDAVGTRDTRYHTAATQREALETARTVVPSLVVVSEEFAGCNAFDLCDTIKQELGLKQVGFIAISPSAVGYDHSRSLLVGVDDMLEANASLETLSDHLLDVAETMEAIMPLSERPELKTADAEKEIADSPFITAESQYQSRDKESPFFELDGRAVISTETQQSSDNQFYHGFDNEPESAPPKIDEQDIDFYHGVKEAMTEEQTHGEVVEEPDSDDPLKAFYDDQDDELNAGVQRGLPRHPNTPPLKREVRLSVDMDTSLQGQLGRLAPLVTRMLLADIDDWLQSNLGMKIDEALRQKARKVFEPIVISTVDKALKNVME